MIIIQHAYFVVYSNFIVMYVKIKKNRPVFPEMSNHALTQIQKNSIQNKISFVIKSIQEAICLLMLT